MPCISMIYSTSYYLLTKFMDPRNVINMNVCKYVLCWNVGQCIICTENQINLTWYGNTAWGREVEYNSCVTGNITSSHSRSVVQSLLLYVACLGFSLQQNGMFFPMSFIRFFGSFQKCLFYLLDTGFSFICCYMFALSCFLLALFLIFEVSQFLLYFIAQWQYYLW
jgi:hypothetical protein